MDTVSRDQREREIKRDLNKIRMINLSSLRADINHYRYMLEDGRGDKAYWKRQIKKAETEMRQTRRKMEGLQ